jgi:hypothetical protein
MLLNQRAKLKESNQIYNTSCPTRKMETTQTEGDQTSKKLRKQTNKQPAPTTKENRSKTDQTSKHHSKATPAEAKNRRQKLKNQQHNNSSKTLLRKTTTEAQPARPYNKNQRTTERK